MRYGDIRALNANGKIATLHLDHVGSKKLNQSILQKFWTVECRLILTSKPLNFPQIHTFSETYLNTTGRVEKVCLK